MSKVVALILESSSHSFVLDRRDVEVSRLVNLISNPAESIQTVDCVIVSLLVPEYVIDPAAEVLAHIRGFHGFSHQLDKFLWVFVCPLWQGNIVDNRLIVFRAEVAMVQVLQNFRHRVELWDQLAHICKVIQGMLV